MERDLLLKLNLIPGVGPVSIQKLLSLSPGEMDVRNIVRQAQIPPAIAEKIIAGLADQSLLEKELSLLEKSKSKVVTILDPNYPELLKNIYAPPPVLYYQGADLSNQPNCAIVGSRAANAYGKRVLHKFIPTLVEHGCTIVSGGARGIDAYAHFETIQAKGKTVVVLGSGLLNLYPPEHYKLFANIVAAGGTILSPFPLATEPAQGNFPARNRIIAGLSKACVVIQAAARSGALITAKFALEQGREVLAVPGPIDDPLSEGCHKLIQEGAGLVHSVEDILLALGLKGKEISLETAALPTDQPMAEVKDMPLDRRIQMLCSKQAQSLDDLADGLGIDPSDLHDPLFQLQIAGKLVQNMAGLYEAPQPF